MHPDFTISLTWERCSLPESIVRLTSVIADAIELVSLDVTIHRSPTEILFWKAESSLDGSEHRDSEQYRFYEQPLPEERAHHATIAEMPEHTRAEYAGGATHLVEPKGVSRERSHHIAAQLATFLGALRLEDSSMRETVYVGVWGQQLLVGRQAGRWEVLPFLRSVVGGRYYPLLGFTLAARNDIGLVISVDPYAIGLPFRMSADDSGSIDSEALRGNGERVIRLARTIAMACDFGPTTVQFAFQGGGPVGSAVMEHLRPMMGQVSGDMSSYCDTIWK